MPGTPSWLDQELAPCLDFLVSKQEAVEALACETGQDPDWALAIIAPELLRYNQVRDLAETAALEWAYIRGGSQVADFSIGRFQMKPSFIEAMERSAHCLPASSAKFFRYGPLSHAAIRRERLDRLKNFDWQLRYAFLYLELARVYFGDDLRLIATAYNYGFDRPEREIRNWSEVRAFPFGRKYQGEQFAYWEVSSRYLFIKTR